MALSSKRPGALLIRVPRNKENRNSGKYNWENPPVTNLKHTSSLFILTWPSLTLILVYKDFLVDYHRAEEDGYKKRKLVITRTTQEQQDIPLSILHLVSAWYHHCKADVFGNVLGVDDFIRTDFRTWLNNFTLGSIVSLRRWYQSLPPLPAVAFFFQANVLFSAENTESWPILAHFGYFVAKFTHFLGYFLQALIMQ